MSTLRRASSAARPWSRSDRPSADQTTRRMFLALDVPELTQAVPECLEVRAVLGRRGECQEADLWDSCGVLCLGGERHKKEAQGEGENAADPCWLHVDLFISANRISGALRGFENQQTLGLRFRGEGQLLAPIPDRRCSCCYQLLRSDLLRALQFHEVGVLGDVAARLPWAGTASCGRVHARLSNQERLAVSDPGARVSCTREHDRNGVCLLRSSIREGVSTDICGLSQASVLPARRRWRREGSRQSRQCR
jgi:hypothetical protein